MAAERKTKLSKNLLRMKVRGRRGGGWGNRGTWASGPGRGSGGRRREAPGKARGPPAWTFIHSFSACSASGTRNWIVNPGDSLIKPAVG